MVTDETIVPIVTGETMADQKEEVLTPRMLHFARCVAAGMSQSDAYREAYNVQKASSKTVNEKASRMMARDKVRARVEWLIKRREQELVRAAVSDKELVLRTLRSKVQHGETDQTVLKACDLLGRSVGLYRDVQETVDRRDSADIAAELEQRLAELLDDTSGETIN